MVLRDMMAGVYPDGVEDEETSGYHKVMAANNDSHRCHHVLHLSCHVLHAPLFFYSSFLPRTFPFNTFR